MGKLQKVYRRSLLFLHYTFPLISFWHSDQLCKARMICSQQLPVFQPPIVNLKLQPIPLTCCWSAVPNQKCQVCKARNWGNGQRSSPMNFDSSNTFFHLFSTTEWLQSYVALESWWKGVLTVENFNHPNSVGLRASLVWRSRADESSFLQTWTLN